MDRYRVMVRRVVLPDGSIIVETKKIINSSGNNHSQESQSIAVNVSSGHSSVSVSASSEND